MSALDCIKKLERLESTNLDNDTKEFMKNRTSITFIHQFLFYYSGDNYERALYRAIEETIQIYAEQDIRSYEEVKNIINNGSITDKEKLKLLDEHNNKKMKELGI